VNGPGSAGREGFELSKMGNVLPFREWGPSQKGQEGVLKRDLTRRPRVSIPGTLHNAYATVAEATIGIDAGREGDPTPGGYRIIQARRLFDRAAMSGGAGA
jgi:hypothetical protein